MNCPRCSTLLIEHGGPKAGRFHCNTCGTCDAYASGVTSGGGGGSTSGSVTVVDPDLVKGTKEGVAAADMAAPEDTSTPERRTRRRT